jgi:hypothetical protein
VLLVLDATEACLEYWPGGLAHSGHVLMYEPWLTLFAAGMAGGILVVRAVHATRERQLAQEVERRKAAERIANIAFAVRDLMNSPLQILEIHIARLGKAFPEGASSIAQMERAIARLAELNDRLRPYELDVRSRAAREEGLDPVLRGEAARTTAG